MISIVIKIYLRFFLKVEECTFSILQFFVSPSLSLILYNVRRTLRTRDVVEFVTLHNSKIILY